MNMPRNSNGHALNTWTCAEVHGRALNTWTCAEIHGHALNTWTCAEHLDMRVRGCYSNEHLAKFQISIDIVALTRNSELVVMSPNLTQKVHCNCPMPHRGLVDRRTRLRHHQKFGIRDTLI